MANEISVTESLAVRNAALSWGQNVSYRDDQAVVGGPSPGEILVGVHPGLDVSLAQIASPGWCWMCNLDAKNFVTVGVYDSSIPAFYPFLDLKPGGKPQKVFLSKYLLQELAGTGTHMGHTTTLHMLADTAACKVRVDCFER